MTATKVQCHLKYSESTIRYLMYLRYLPYGREVPRTRLRSCASTSGTSTPTKTTISWRYLNISGHFLQINTLSITWCEHLSQRGNTELNSEIKAGAMNKLYAASTCRRTTSHGEANETCLCLWSQFCRSLKTNTIPRTTTARMSSRLVDTGISSASCKSIAP